MPTHCISGISPQQIPQVTSRGHITLLGPTDLTSLSTSQHWSYLTCFLLTVFSATQLFFFKGFGHAVPSARNALPQLFTWQPSHPSCLCSPNICTRVAFPSCPVYRAHIPSPAGLNFITCSWPSGHTSCCKDLFLGCLPHPVQLTFLKGSESKHFRLRQPYTATTTQACPCSSKVGTHNMQISGRGWAPVKLYLQNRQRLDSAHRQQLANP